MARLQILELPTEHHGEEMITPFVLVIDEVTTDSDGVPPSEFPDQLLERIGARAILVFEDTVEIPANGTLPPQWAQ
ncbi:hypothetical protein AB0N46_29295 [Streptomyces albidoflavus]|uniref:hypothetical protein n=1 Tax=Streptomyces albidoflavus TaxID=1886 RepID=UPI003419E4E6